MLLDLVLEHAEHPSQPSELLLEPVNLCAVVPRAHRVALPPHSSEVESKTDRILPHAVQVRLQPRDAAEDVGALVDERPVRRVLRFKRCAQGGDGGEVGRELRLEIGLRGFGRREMPVRAGGLL